MMTVQPPWPTPRVLCRRLVVVAIAAIALLALILAVAPHQAAAQQIEKGTLSSTTVSARAQAAPPMSQTMATMPAEGALLLMHKGLYSRRRQRR